jgi:hypothetical protein
MDRRQLLRLAALAGVSGLAGCGVASRDGIVVDGPGPSAGTAGRRSDRKPPERNGKDGPGVLVRGYLSQAAGDPTDLASAVKRCKSFMTPQLQSVWDPGKAITVVWFDPEVLAEQTTAEGADYTIDLPMTPLGILRKDGTIAPPASSSAQTTVTFTVTSPKQDDVTPLKKDSVTSLKQEDLFISKIKNAPGGMLLSTDALATYYTYRNLYFWDSSGTCLVPDGRYVPNEWEKATVEKHLVEWLLAGPADWLAQAVEQLPENISVNDNPGEVDQRLVVNLSQQADKVDLGRLVSQLTWTLLPEASGISAASDNSPITVKIESTVKKSGGPYLSDNVTAAQAKLESLEAFALVDHRVRRVRVGNEAINDRRVPLTAEQNKDLEWAAFCRDRTSEGISAVAVVRKEKDGRHQQLLIGSVNGEGTASELRLSGLICRQMLRPVFVDSENVLVVGDGKLYHIRRRTGDARRVTISGSSARSNIIAFSVPPEGRRIALVTSAGLWVAAMWPTGTRLIVGQPRLVPTVLTRLTGVAFSAENWLAVSGVYGDEPRIVEITLDGATKGDATTTTAKGDSTTTAAWLVRGRGKPQITSLTAFPEDPRGLGSTKRIYYTANNQAYDATSSSSGLTQEVAGEPAVPSRHFATNAFFLE